MSEICVSPATPNSDEKQIVQTSISHHSEGLPANSPFLQALSAASSGGGSKVVDALQYRANINDLLYAIAPGPDSSWHEIKDKNTDETIGLVIRAYLGEDLAELKISKVAPKDDDPDGTPMAKINLSVGGVHWHTITQTIAIGSASLSLASAITSGYLFVVKKGLQKTLENLEAREAKMYKCLPPVEQAANAEAAEIEVEINETFDELMNVTSKLIGTEGFMIGALALAVVAETFSLLVHTTNFSLTVTNKTNYKIKWHTPSFSHGNMEGCPSDGKGNKSYYIPKQIMSDDDPIIAVAEFSFIEKEALYGVTGHMQFDFLDANDNVVKTCYLAMNCPYSGANGLGLSFNKVPSHDNPHEHVSWSAESDDNQIKASVGISALHDKHKLPTSKEKGYNYAAALVFE